MPPTLRSNMEQVIKDPPWPREDATLGVTRMLGYALTTPYFGVMK